jgi:hypothetical protein
MLSPERRWRGAAGAALGSLAGYLLLMLIVYFIPPQAQGRWRPGSFYPAPLDMLTGILIGAGMGAGISLTAKKPQLSCFDTPSAKLI